MLARAYILEPGNRSGEDGASERRAVDVEQFKRIVAGQFEAALAMLRACIDACPDTSWDTEPPNAVAKYPFWHVAYHALCFVDCYLSPSNEAFSPRPEFHPAGMLELSEEYPSRRFSRTELRAYLDVCRDKLALALASENAESLAGSSGFEWLPFTRSELHLYNLRHVQHHTGQLTAYLRRNDVETPWVKSGWKSGVVSIT